MSIDPKRSDEVEISPAQAEPRESPAEPASPLPPSAASNSNIDSTKGLHASSSTTTPSTLIGPGSSPQSESYLLELKWCYLDLKLIHFLQRRRHENSIQSSQNSIWTVTVCIGYIGGSYSKISSTRNSQIRQVRATKVSATLLSLSQSIITHKVMAKPQHLRIVTLAS